MLMELSDRHRRFLLIEQIAIPTVINLVLNGLIAWAVFRAGTAIPLWGESSVGVDLLITGFLLPFLTCVVISSGVARQVRSGKVPPLPSSQLPLSRWFQRSSSTRGLLLGAAGAVLGAAPIVWALSIGEAGPFPVASFVVFKAVWAGMLTLAVTPFIGWWALASASRAVSSEARLAAGFGNRD
jgi:hypothetical protein